MDTDGEAEEGDGGEKIKLVSVFPDVGMTKKDPVDWYCQINELKTLKWVQV